MIVALMTARAVNSDIDGLLKNKKIIDNIYIFFLSKNE